MWLGEPAPTHTRLWERRFRSTKTRSTCGNGNGATAPATKPVAFSTWAGEAILALGAPAARAILTASALRSPGMTVVRKDK